MHACRVASKLYTEAYTFITGKKQDKEPGKADMQNLLKNIRRNTCFANGKNLLDKILTKKYRDGLILLLYNEQPFQYSTKDHYPHPEEAGLLFLFAAAVPFILEEDKTVQVTVSGKEVSKTRSVGCLSVRERVRPLRSPAAWRQARALTCYTDAYMFVCHMWTCSPHAGRGSADYMGWRGQKHRRLLLLVPWKSVRVV